MRIVITGDFAITQSYNALTKLDNSLVEFFSASDMSIVNLEAPVTKSDTPIFKTGPRLKSHYESTLEVLKALHIKVVTLSNNHLLDYDEQGVADTLDFCKEHDIKTVGAGMNVEQAAKILFVKTDEGTLAVVNFSENEWASATPERAGANPMDLIENVRQIKKARENADYVFVIVHGGHEYYNLPSPRMVNQYRFYAESGADIVVGHHTHCISGYEYHNGVPIYYSLGNFLFNRDNANDDWYNGMILEVEIKEGKLLTQIHLVCQTKHSFELSLLTGKAKEEVLSRVNGYSNSIQDEQLLSKEWNSYVSGKAQSYMRYWSFLSFINNRFIRSVLYKMGFHGRNKSTQALFLNLMRCEAHRDLSVKVLADHL